MSSVEVCVLGASVLFSGGKLFHTRWMMARQVFSTGARECRPFLAKIYVWPTYSMLFGLQIQGYYDPTASYVDSSVATPVFGRAIMLVFGSVVINTGRDCSATELDLAPAIGTTQQPFQGPRQQLLVPDGSDCRHCID